MYISLYYHVPGDGDLYILSESSKFLLANFASFFASPMHWIIWIWITTMFPFLLQLKQCLTVQRWLRAIVFLDQAKIFPSSLFSFFPNPQHFKDYFDEEWGKCISLSSFSLVLSRQRAEIFCLCFQCAWIKDMHYHT